MAKILMQYTCCLIVLTVCIDEGDGRWKRKDAENLQHDIDLFKRMAEKIEHEIKVFYEDHSGERIKTGDAGKIKEKHAKNIRDSKTDNNNFSRHVGITRKNDYVLNGDIVVNGTDTKDVPSVNFIENHESNDINGAIDDEARNSNTNSNANNSNWPKFEEILLAMGKQYDWKNDRWIKVKRKLRELKMKKAVSSENYHEIHKFSYRTVKLNSSKSRRHVVIAVTAVT